MTVLRARADLYGRGFLLYKLMYNIAVFVLLFGRYSPQLDKKEANSHLK